MPHRPRIVVLNASCLDAAAEHRAWAHEQNLDMVADEAARTLQPQDVDRWLTNADALVLPACVAGLPSEAHMKRHASIKALSIAASGYDWLDLAAATRQGIVVSNVQGGIGAQVVADQAFALMLAAARQVAHHDRLIIAGNHTRGLGHCVFGKTLGIVGLGHIGKAVAHRARGFDMAILACSRSADPQFISEEGVERVSLDELLRRSDFVSLHLRLTDRNVKLIGARELALMKPTAYLVNTARRELVDEEALIAAITAGRLAGAGLDDPPTRKDNPLLGHPSVVFNPHLGNRAFEGIHGVFREALENALAVLHGARPRHVVNPEVYDSPALRTAASEWASP